MVRHVWLVVLLTGCAYRVDVRTQPVGAQITTPSGTTAIAPATIQMRWAPFGGQPLCAVAPGYRPLEVRPQREIYRPIRTLLSPISRPQRALGIKPAGELELILTPLRGPPDAWDLPDQGPDNCSPATPQDQEALGEETE